MATTTRQFEVTLHQDMFAKSTYTNLDGSEHTKGSVGPFAVLSVKPWYLQIGEKGPDGVWRMENVGTYMRKAEGLADAARQGIQVDHVSWHPDYVESRVIN